MHETISKARTWLHISVLDFVLKKRVNVLEKYVLISLIYKFIMLCPLHDCKNTTNVMQLCTHYMLLNKEVHIYQETKGFRTL
jgi:hypothetical protein